MTERKYLRFGVDFTFLTVLCACFAFLAHMHRAAEGLAYQLDAYQPLALVFAVCALAFFALAVIRSISD